MASVTVVLVVVEPGTVMLFLSLVPLLLLTAAVAVTATSNATGAAVLVSIDSWSLIFPVLLIVDGFLGVHLHAYTIYMQTHSTVAAAITTTIDCTTEGECIVHNL